MIVVIVRENSNGVFVNKEAASADWFIIINEEGHIRVAPTGMQHEGSFSGTGEQFSTIDEAYRFIITK